MLTQVYSQTPYFERYGHREGLAGEKDIFDIFQDSRKYLWIGTSNGISRYDGKTFTNFQDHLDSYVILRIAEGDNGRIWVLSFLGNLSIIENDSLYQYSHNSVVREFLRRGKCYSFSVDTSGVLYATTRNGYFTVDAHGKLTWLLRNHEGYNGACLVERNGRDPLWFFAKDSMSTTAFLYRMDLKGNIQSTLPIHVDLSQNGLSSIEYNKQNGVELLKVNADLLLLKQKSIRLQESFDYDFMHSYLDRQGGIWLSNPNEFSGATNSYTFSSTGFNHQYAFLANHSVVSFLQDHEGGMWFGSLISGLYYMPESTIWQYEAKNELWPNDFIRTILSHGDSLVFGTSYGVLGSLGSNSFRQHNLDNGVKGSFSKNVVSLLQDDQNRIYTLLDFELYTYNGQEPQLFADKRNRNVIQASSSQKDSSIWLINRKSVGKILKDTINWMYEVPSKQIRAVYEDQLGQLWLLGYDGLWKLEKNGFQNLEAQFPELSGSMQQFFYANGAHWILTFERLYCLQSDSLVDVSKKLNISKGSIRSMSFFKGNLWLNSNRGLKCVEVTDIKYKPLAEIQGLTNTVHAFITSHKDQLVLASKNKIFLVGLEDLEPDTNDIPLFVKSIRFNDRDTIVLANYELSYKQNVMELELGTVNFKSPNELKFQFQLSGIDERPRTSSSGLIRYNSLSPGTYQFELKALKLSGHSSSPSIQFSIEISPPFWATWWFRGIIFLLLAGLLFLLIQLRLKALLKKGEMEKKMVELESSALRAQMNPHFIFNVLGSIQAYILNNEAEQANDYLSRFALLVRHTLNNSRDQLISLAQEVEALHYYLQLEQMRFDGVFEYIIDVEKSIQQENTYVPPLLVQPLVENAILHGVSSLECDGLVEISIRKGHNSLICSITDNGVGLQSHEKTKEKGLYESVGMFITKERLRLLNNGEHEDLDQIFRCETSHRKPSGTAITIKLPIFNKSKIQV